MRVLLITTLPNRVCHSLQSCAGIDLEVLDVGGISSGRCRQLVVETVGREIPGIILTYRCPCLLPEACFSLPVYGAYNLHPSLLPKHKGLNPWPGIMAEQEGVNGVTLHRISWEADAGEILYQEKYKISPSDTLYMARHKADVIAGRLALRLVADVLKRSGVI